VPLWGRPARNFQGDEGQEAASPLGYRGLHEAQSGAFQRTSRGSVKEAANEARCDQRTSRPQG